MPKPPPKRGAPKKVVRKRTFDESLKDLTKGRIFTHDQLNADSSAGRNIHVRRKKKP